MKDPPRRPSWMLLEHVFLEVPRKVIKIRPLGSIFVKTMLSEDDFRWNDYKFGRNFELCVLPPNLSTGLSTSQRLSNGQTFDN